MKRDNSPAIKSFQPKVIPAVARVSKERLMLHVVLYQPEIPSNTGNIIRLCANTGARLHLIQPLGFDMDDKQLKRAGLDYHEWADVQIHPDLESFSAKAVPGRILAFSTRARRIYTGVTFSENDALLFGPETRGLPPEVLEAIPVDRRLRLPMLPGNRSLNLSNTVAVTVFEVWKQLEFPGGR